jgi:hypothetical protein
MVSKRILLIAGAVLLSCAPGFSQGIIHLANGTAVKVQTKLNRAIGFGPKQAVASTANTDAVGLQFYTANYLSLGSKNLPFNIVGTDPSLGASTTTVATVIVPLKFVFPNSGHPTLDGTNVVAATENSPIFLTSDYTESGADLGVTQYGDAIQRGEFWNLPGFSRAGYHVLLGTPAVAPTVTVTVPTGKGNAYELIDGGFIGVVDNGFFDSLLNALLPSYTANQLPIFLTDNVFLAPFGEIQFCCILGFHNSQAPPIATAQTWIYAAYTEPGTFMKDIIVDVQALSHEVSEWLNDPFAGSFPGINMVAPYVLPNTGGFCQINFETGDVLASPPIAFAQVTNGTTYHLQDEAFVTYFLHTSPSFSVNGWYSFIGTFTTFSTLCGPG